jgi:hypothetical protein
VQAEDNRISDLRALGGTEHLFWLLDQVTPKHFAMVAEISGATPLSAWRAALDALQRSDPLLSASIRVDASGPIFRHARDADIPLRVVPYDGASWQREVEAELARPFDFEVAPLLRVVLLHKHDRATLILVAHHSIADGIGATSYIERVLRSLDGQPLHRYGTVEPLEYLLKAEIDTLPRAVSPAPDVQALRAAAPIDASLCVEGFALTSAMTTRLVQRARSERTTVHSALSVAVNQAMWRLSPHWRNTPIRTLHPINGRHLSEPAANAAGVYITLAITADSLKPGASFWDMARAANAQLSPARTREALLTAIRNDKQAADAQPSVDQFAFLASQVLVFDVLLSNLGRRPMPTAYGGLRLDALWGPSVWSGFPHDQVIGVATAGERLRLVHTSLSPVRGLLEDVAATVDAACG